MRKMVLYKYAENDYIIELWECSTKHPDAVHYFSRYILENYDDNLRPFANINDCFVQWCAFIASRVLFEFTATKILNACFLIKQEYDEVYSSIYEMLETGYFIIVENGNVRIENERKHV